MQKYKTIIQGNTRNKVRTSTDAHASKGKYLTENQQVSSSSKWGAHGNLIKLTGQGQCQLANTVAAISAQGNLIKQGLE